MTNFGSLVWIETRKALRSRMPLWTILGSLILPLAIAFLIFISRNPEIAEQLGIISAKAELLSYAATDWPNYLTFLGQMIGAGGFFFFVVILGWTFGREFADHTVTELLAVPVRRSSILLAKFVVAAVWAIVWSLVNNTLGLLLAYAMKIEGGSTEIMLHGLWVLVATSIMTIVVVLPFAWLASAGRGYLLPLGTTVVIMILTNVAVIAGWGEVFPWAIPLLFSQGEPLTPASLWAVWITGLVGVLLTLWWWQRAEQS